jgi:DNA-binding response OmpR family regulator
MQPNHILVCVQNPDHAELLAYNLKKAGYHPTIFTSGEVLDYAIYHKPDMIILGSAKDDQVKAFISKEVKNNPALKNTLVVCLTTNDGCPFIASPFNFFIDACLVLPQKPRQIVTAVKQLFSMHPPAFLPIPGME